MTSLTDTLLNTEDIDEALKLLAPAVWRKDHNGEDCPADMVPTVKDLARWRGELPAHLKTGRFPFAKVAGPEVPPGEEINDWGSFQRLLYVANEGSLRDAHCDWKNWPEDEAGIPRPKIHPLSKIVREWQHHRSMWISPEGRLDSRILPAVTTAIQDQNRRSELMANMLAGEHEKPADLSFFPQAERHEVPLLDLVDGTGAPIRTAGRGAPLEARLIVSAILAVPQSSRGINAVRFSLPLRDLVEAIYAGKWHRANQWEPLRNMLESVGSRGIPLRHRGTIWRPVFCREIPDKDARLDAPVTFDVAFPPGTTTGPQIDPVELAKRGVRSSPEWRAYIAAATLAWSPGRTRVPVPRARGRYGWARDPQAYPVLTQNDRKRLAFGESKGNYTTNQIDSPWQDIPGFTALKGQTDDKTFVTGWRILPDRVAEEIKKKGRS